MHGPIPGQVAEQPSPDAAQPRWSFSEFVLCRRGALPFAELAGLGAHRADALLAEAEEVSAERAALEQELLLCLHAVIPRASSEARRILIKLKRDLFNRRVPGSDALGHARAALTDRGRGLLDRWVRDDHLEKDLHRRADEAAGEELAASRRTLAWLASTEKVRQGLQLSSRTLYRTVEKLVREGVLAQVGSKRTRHARATLVSYLYRMALKTSPFATFTELLLHFPGRHFPGRPPGRPAERRRLVRTSRDHLTWIEGEIVHRLEECWDALPHRLNNTARTKERKVEFFVRADRVSDGNLGGESVLRLVVNAPVRALLEALAAGPRTRADLAGVLARLGLAQDATRPLIDRLVQVGLIERSLDVPDQEPDYGRRLLEKIARLPGARAAACGAALRSLCEIEDAFPAAHAARRAELLADGQRAIEQVAASVGIEPPVDDDARSYVYEDVAGGDPPRSWNQSLLDAERDRIALLQRLLPLFDDSGIEQRGLYDLFAAEYGPAGRCHDLLAFYQRFAKQSPAAVSALMTGAGQPWARELRELRSQFCDLLDAQLASADAEACAAVTLDQAELERLVQRFPAHLDPWGSAAYGLQFCRLEDGPRIVVNNVMTGYGGAYSRFCPLFEPPSCREAGRAEPSDRPGREPSLRELVAARIREGSATGRQVDLTAVLGMNANLHPPLTDLELVYPRCRSTGERAEALTLRDLVLVGDPVRRRVRVRSRRDGAPLRLLPHNFLFPGAAATLYRFLCALAPIINFRGGLWSKYQTSARRQVSGARRFPRLELGRLVLDRQTWTWPVAMLPPAPAAADAEEGLASLVGAREWRRQLGLPREGFFRFHPARNPAPEGADWVRELRSWALAARNHRLRRPHYVDFANPLLTSVLFKQLRGLSDSVFRFQECLPATSDYLEGSAANSAEEHIIELDRVWPAGPNQTGEDEHRDNDD